MFDPHPRLHVVMFFVLSYMAQLLKLDKYRKIKWER